MFHVGQKVVCIDAQGLDLRGRRPALIEDKIYIVRELHKCSCGHGALGFGYLHYYDYIICSLCERWFESSMYLYAASLFIPLDEYTEMDKMVSELTETQKETV